MKHTSSVLLTHRCMVPLLREFRHAMRELLFELCEEFDGEYRRSATRLRLPISLFRLIGERLQDTELSHWKIVGWIEDLNDLLFFVDLAAQTRQEGRGRDSQDFVEQVWSHCAQQYYEHTYLDELFPTGILQPKGFSSRLSTVCSRLAQQVTQEAILLMEGLATEWMSAQRSPCAPIPLRLVPNFERGEVGGCLYLGIGGGYLHPPSHIHKKLAGGTVRAWICHSGGKAEISIGRQTFPLSSSADDLAKGWQYHPPCWVREPDRNGEMGLALGPTLVYGKDRMPRRLIPTASQVAGRVKRALKQLKQVWPEGNELVALLSSCIIPLQASGVVSFSYRNRPGLSFINVFERNQLDLVDDLVHENSHHHLNLLLRKYQLFTGDQNQEIFYSPWRRSLRPLRGIVHATFTFSMGAMLFAKIAGSEGTRKKGTGVNPRLRSRQIFGRDLKRSVARGLEEVASVSYSMKDLKGMAVRQGWMSEPGQSLVRALERMLVQARKLLTPLESTLTGTRYRADLLCHRLELEQAAGQYQRRGKRQNLKAHP